MKNKDILQTQLDINTAENNGIVVVGIMESCSESRKVCGVGKPTELFLHGLREDCINYRISN